MHQTVVETSEFIRQAKTCLSNELKDEFVNAIAKDPLKGVLIQGTGGARKIRWAAGANQGKRAGVRIVYYYHDKTTPVFLFAVYGKTQKANLSSAERALLKTIIRQIVETYGSES